MSTKATEALQKIAADVPRQEDSIHGPRLRCQHCGHAWCLDGKEAEHHSDGCAYIIAGDALRTASDAPMQLSWYCGCGHTNGVNLATCAACGRDPNGEWRGKPPV